GNALERLRLPAWPVDFHSRFPRPTQSEMQPLIVRRKITARRGSVTGLSIDPHLGAKAVSVALRPDQRNDEPMVPIGPIPQDYRPISKHRYHYINITIAIEVAESGAPPRDGFHALNSSPLQFSCQVSRNQWDFFVAQSRIHAIDVIHD